MENLKNNNLEDYENALAVDNFEKAEQLFKEVSYAASTKGCGSGTCIE